MSEFRFQSEDELDLKHTQFKRVAHEAKKASV